MATPRQPTRSNECEGVSKASGKQKNDLLNNGLSMCVFQEILIDF